MTSTGPRWPTAGRTSYSSRVDPTRGHRPTAEERPTPSGRPHDPHQGRDIPFLPHFGGRVRSQPHPALASFLRALSGARHDRADGRFSPLDPPFDRKRQPSWRQQSTSGARKERPDAYQDLANESADRLAGSIFEAESGAAGGAALAASVRHLSDSDPRRVPARRRHPDRRLSPRPGHQRLLPVSRTSRPGRGAPTDTTSSTTAG